jgi:hypothetical protein
MLDRIPKYLVFNTEVLGVGECITDRIAKKNHKCNDIAHCFLGDSEVLKTYPDLNRHMFGGIAIIKEQGFENDI